MSYCCIENLLEVLLGTVKDFIGYLFSYISAVLYLLRLARPKVQVKVS